MVKVCLYFQVHQPHRLKWWHPGQKGYFDDWKNEHIFRRVARKCYWPAGKNILYNLRKFKNCGRDFKVSYSLSGTFLEQCKRFDPDLLHLWQEMADTGRVEFLGETYYHSLASLFEEPDEFKEQVQLHVETVEELFGQRPKVFRNTELLYNNRIASLIEGLGFEGIITEGTERLLEWRSPNYVYRPVNSDLKVLLRNYKLSDDVAYRFSARWWDEWPLTAEKFAFWLSAAQGDCVNLFMDYETFGEHQWEETGIFNFLEVLPDKILDHGHLEFATPGELAQLKPRGTIDAFEMGKTISWADLERDESAWLGNRMQQICFQELKNMRHLVETEEEKELWRLLQTSDQIYYLCTKGFGDGNVHSYFSPFGSPYDAYANFLAILNDFKMNLLMRREDGED